MNELTSGTTLGRHSDLLAQLGDREPSNLIEAQAVIESIRAEKGYLDDETLQDLRNINEQSRKKILHLVQLKRETEAAYTTSISEQLYSSKFRFLYELIQNADDSSYWLFDNAYVRFEITPEKFVVETNEIGFSRRNIDAICATGRSSKKASIEDNHIGEKGFGFKAVFSIAEEVHIQSGWWSFCFRHRKGEDGLGMVTPLDAKPDELPEGVTTRITLHYAEDTKQEYPRLLEAVREVPDTTILFLQRLREIHVNILDDGGQYEKTSISKRYDPRRHTCTIQRRKVSNDVVTDEDCKYHLFRHTVQSMPTHERRTGRTDAKIELAFPFDPISQQPKLSEQGHYVSAFLPLQRLLQLQILIHSDFVTSASRESVIDCPWNRKLCEGVAATFISAVTDTFAKPDHPCKHSWLEWLPTSGMERPWKTLYSSIVEKLTTENVAQTWESGQFKAPKQLRYVVQSGVYCGKPLLPDLRDEIYLARGYTYLQRSRLAELGVQNMSGEDFIERLKADVVRSNSTLRTTPATDSWHETFAEACIQAIKSSSGAKKRKILRLAIVPLLNANQWTGAPGVSMGGAEKVFFSYTEQTPIPDLPNLRLLERSASLNAKRRVFYETLGVEECPKETVFAKIKQRHADGRPDADIIPEMQYLYHQSCDLSVSSTWMSVPLFDGRTVKAHSPGLYFPSNGAFDMYRLVPTQSNQCYLSEALYNAEPLTSRVNEETWRDWLARTVGAQYRPALLGPCQAAGRYALSPALKAVLEHNPSMFLGTLREHWSVYQHHAYLVEEALGDCCVPCLSEDLTALQLTYLPTMEVMAEIHRLGVDQNDFALLSLPEGPLNEADYRSWKFLESFGVDSKPQLHFYKVAITAIASNDVTVDTSIVASIYRRMAQLLTVEDYDSLRDFVDADDCIWDDDHDSWASRSACCWNGPGFLQFKVVLSRTYRSYELLEPFFSTILEIPDATLEDVFDEIESLRDHTDVVELSLMRDIYTYLGSEANSDTDWQKIKTVFSEKRLVLGENNTSFTLSNCIWGAPFTLNGFLDLSILYPDLERFFVRRLKVKKASLSMLITEVKRMAGAATPHIEQIRTRLIEIGMMLARSTITENVLNALNSLKDTRFLPKKLNDGTSVLLGADDDFAIPDHQRYRDAFATVSTLLDFQVHEVQSLHSVFGHMGLTHRYLSSMVKEASEVGESCIEDEVLSRQVSQKAYALYCCAAKHKSDKAFYGDRALFEQLAFARLYTTNEMTTNLILPLGSAHLRVPSERLAIYSEVSESQLKIYVPGDPQQRRMCFRSQLPNLLTTILAVGLAATFDVSSIMSCSMEELEDVLDERDIPPVSWIDRPVTVAPSNFADSRPFTPTSNAASSDSATLIPRSGLLTPDITPTHYARAAPVIDLERHTEVTPPPEYPALIEQVVRSARRAGRGYVASETNIANGTPFNNRFRDYDHHATFGTRERNPFAHDRRIGAAGEGYVFEILSHLDLPNFSEDNWRSTIRGELARSTRFPNIASWTGRETADIVYVDDSGQLTQYLRDHSEGRFPHQIREDRNFQTYPIEYYLEVKTTTGQCGTRFYMSSGQYKRMKSMALEILDSQPSKVYVILRVYDLMEQDVGLKIFVDPLRFRGTKLDFEAEQWFVSTT